MDGIGKEFMEKSKYKYLLESFQKRGFPQPPLELAFDISSQSIPLPSISQLPPYQIELKTAIEKRKTLRRYSQTSLSLEELTYLLWITQGVKEVSDATRTSRNVPSAGARHAFETYLVINRVGDLKPGLYRYLALKHALLPIDTDPEFSYKVAHACLNQQQIKTSAVTFVWVAVKERMYWRYGERGYRYLHLDAGHVCQNLYLGAEAIGCGMCAIAAFDDDQLNAVLGLDGDNCFVIYLGSLGKR